MRKKFAFLEIIKKIFFFFLKQTEFYDPDIHMLPKRWEDCRKRRRLHHWLIKKFYMLNYCLSFMNYY